MIEAQVINNQKENNNAVLIKDNIIASNDNTINILMIQRSSEEQSIKNYSSRNNEILGSLSNINPMTETSLYNTSNCKEWLLIQIWLCQFYITFLYRIQGDHLDSDLSLGYLLTVILHIIILYLCLMLELDSIDF